MNNAPTLARIVLKEIILTPVEMAGTMDIPIHDENGNMILDEQGLKVCEG